MPSSCVPLSRIALCRSFTGCTFALNCAGWTDRSAHKRNVLRRGAERHLVGVELRDDPRPRLRVLSGQVHEQKRVQGVDQRQAQAHPLLGAAADRQQHVLAPRVLPAWQRNPRELLAFCGHSHTHHLELVPSSRLAEVAALNCCETAPVSVPRPDEGVADLVLPCGRVRDAAQQIACVTRIGCHDRPILCTVAAVALADTGMGTSALTVRAPIKQRRWRFWQRLVSKKLTHRQFHRTRLRPRRCGCVGSGRCRRLPGWSPAAYHWQPGLRCAATPATPPPTPG